MMGGFTEDSIRFVKTYYLTKITLYTVGCNQSLTAHIDATVYGVDNIKHAFNMDTHAQAKIRYDKER